jgi:putative salt-induced outer membrane protein YdiY
MCARVRISASRLWRIHSPLFPRLALADRCNVSAGVVQIVTPHGDTVTLNTRWTAILILLSVVLADSAAGDEGPEVQAAAAAFSGAAGGILTAERMLFADPDPSSQPEDQPLPSEEEAKAAEADEIEGPVVEPEPSWFDKLIEGWQGEVRLGTDFYSGTSERTRFRGGFNINKKYDGHKTALRTDYSFARTNGGETENRLVSGLIQDWGTGQSKFSGVFFRATGELDRFKSYDSRLNVSSGGRYQIVKDEKTDVLFRLGLSVTREFAGTRDEWVPEGAFFLSLSHKISDKQKLTANVDYFPEVEQPERYRINARATWDYKIDEESGLSLRIGAENRFDKSQVNREERNDLDLRAELVWQF